MTEGYASWLLLSAMSVGVVAALTAWGFALLLAVPGLRVATAPMSRLCEAMLYGVLGFSALGFVGVLAGLELRWTFALGTAIAIGANLLLGQRSTPVLQPVRLAENSGAERALNWLAPLLVIVGSLLWSTNNIRGLEQATDGVMLVPWQDFFFHARQIANFGGFDGDRAALHWTMYGESLAPYHYGSYMVAALVSRLADIPAIQVATSLYPVLGMVLTGAAMLVLTEATCGAGAALVAVALLYFVPDPSCWIPGLGRQNSYFFFQEVGIGGAYAVAVLGLALACALRARKANSIGLSIWSVALLASTALFKVQIGLAYGAFFLIAIVLTAPRLTPGFKAAGALLVVGGFALFVTIASAVPNAPTMGISLDGVRRAFGLETGESASTLRALGLLPAGAGYIWLVTYGLLLPPVLYLGWKLRRDLDARPTLLIMALFLLAHVYVRLLIKDNQGFGDTGEVNRKTFVLPYFVIVYGCAVLIWRAFEDAICNVGRRPLPVKGGAVSVAALMFAATAVAGYRLQWWPHKSEGHSRLLVQQGLFDAAAYLRNTARRDELVQLCENDDYIQLAALSERPIYVAKLIVNAPPMDARERERLQALKTINRQLDFDSAARVAKGLKISWWLVNSTCHTLWEDARKVVFSSAGYRLYHFEQ